MNGLRPRRRGALGAPPGTLTPRADARPTRVVVRSYTRHELREGPLESVDQLGALLDRAGCLWIEITGLADAATKIAALGRALGLHDLSLEGALDPGQRGKVQHFDDYSLLVVRTLAMSERVTSQPLSVFVGDGFVLTVQESDVPALEPIRERLRHARGRIRERGADYLAYAIIDSVVDHYFPVVEGFDDHLEGVEDAMLEDSEADMVTLARGARRDLQVIRHAVWPARDVVTSLLNEDAARVTEDTRLHLRDCYDHIVQLQEMIEYSREITTSLLDSYRSRVSLRTNEVMKVLTVIATIFIPLTFITGLYGMNFNPRTSPLNMPELDWYWGYPFSWLLMIGVGGASWLYFRRRRWSG